MSGPIAIAARLAALDIVLRSAAPADLLGHLRVAEQFLEFLADTEEDLLLDGIWGLVWGLERPLTAIRCRGDMPRALAAERCLAALGRCRGVVEREERSYAELRELGSFPGD